jgi:hypothetical protein
MKVTPSVTDLLSVVCIALFTWAISAVAAEQPNPRGNEDRQTLQVAVMPRVEDYTHMWWAQGFPSHTPAAPWTRCIQTGRYAMSLDTETLRIGHLGPVPAGLSYTACARVDNGVWQSLSAADLALTITANGRIYRCTAGGKWTNFTGPRLIESGRFVQRADVTDLVFTAEDGSRLNVEARFETAAWPDRLGLILAARPGLQPIPAGEARIASSEQWRDAAMEIRLTTAQGVVNRRWQSAAGETWSDNKWREVFVSWLAGTPQPQPASAQVTVRAGALPDGGVCPVDYDPARGWHRVNLDSVAPIVPPGERARQNDALERVQLVLTNPEATQQTARLLFEKNASGMRLPIGAPITGVSAVLRDPAGNPTGIPVQISKNWHGRPEGGVYAGVWFHGFSQVHLPPGAKLELELTLAYGHWGGVAAASHAQLCLIGWGSNQLWDQSALGAWGESICYEPDQAQAQAGILDVRPLMVRSMNRDLLWTWTHNVGGGDFFRLFDDAGNRVFPGRMRTAYQRQGPCLTEVTYAGRTGTAIEHAATVSLYRSDDVVRGTYRLHMDVHQALDFSRFVIFQIGADTYSYTGERQLAVGNETGLLRQWETQWGGDTYRTEPLECTGRVPWISLHEAVSRAGQAGEGKQGAWANRGLVIRAWDARLGGRKAAPWAAERGVKARGADTSTVDLVPPPGTRRLEPGDFVEATIEHIVMPQFAKDYYGPNEALRAALGQGENTWRMIHREAAGNDRRVDIKTGTLERLDPAVRIGTVDDGAEFTLAGGLGYVPVTFTGLASPRGHALSLDGQRLDQSVHGNDFWQTDYDPAAQRWEITFNIPAGKTPVRLMFGRQP